MLGDGLEEEACAEVMEWPFVRITLTPQPELPPAVQPALQGTAQLKQAAAAPDAAASKRQRMAGGEGGVGGNDADDGDNDDDDDDDDDEGGGGDGDDADTKQASGDGKTGNSMAADVAAAGRLAAKQAGISGANAWPRADALGSAGHPLLELTAQQLLKLALSME